MPARKIETEIAVGGERQFNDAMKGLNSNLKTLRSDMALTTAEFGKNDTSLQGLTKKQLILGQTISQQKEVVNAFKTRLEAVEKQYGKNSAQADKAGKLLIPQKLN